MTLLLLTALLAASPGDDQTAAPLVPKAIRTWGIELPADPFQKISGSIPIAHDGGTGFPVVLQGNGLRIDTDGDNLPDRDVEGRVNPDTQVRTARVVLSGERDGAPFRYPVRLELKGTGWAYASSSVMSGNVEGSPISLIDLNGNGSFTDVGQDALAVDGSDVAQFLGETVVLKGHLHTLTLAPDASSAKLEPYAGDTGVLDLVTEFGGKGVMLGAVVKSADGHHSFELSRATEGLEVPVGRYRLVNATLGLGEARATVDPAVMRSIKVKKNRTTALQWGAPIKATFTYETSGSELVLDPERVRYVGAAGERWVGWDPVGKSPTFHIKDAVTGKVLIDAVFPGSC